jgi:hypothetical protein
VNCRNDLMAGKSAAASERRADQATGAPAVFAAAFPGLIPSPTI